MTQSGLDIEIVGQGPDLVLLHSLLTDRTSYRALAERLSDQRRLTLVNMPGFGASPPATAIDGYADRIAAMFAELSLPPATAVLGNGLGAFVGLRLAIDHGHLFDRLVLVGSGVAFPEQGRATFRAMADKAEADGMDQLADAAMLRMFPQDYIDAHPEVIDDRQAVFKKIDPAVFAAACRALSILDLAPELDRIRNPVLVIVGEHDSATVPALGRALAAQLPNGQVIELTGAGHAPHMQTPDALVDAIAPFLGLRR